MPVAASAFLSGIALFCLADADPRIIGFCAAAGLMAGVFRRLVWLVVITVGIILASLRFDVSEARVGQMLATVGKEERVTAIVLRKETPRPTSQRLLLKLDDATVRKTTADLPRFPEYREGQTLAITCRWEMPTSREDQSAIRNRYAKGLYVSCKPAGEITVQKADRFCWHHPLLCGRLWIIKHVEELWPRPTRSLVLGLLLGDKADFPAQVLEQFSRAGISHIIALSGFNITIIIVSLEAVALRLALKKNWRAPAIVMCIGVFVVFVGSAASIVRAACMGCLALVGKTLGRRPSATRLLLMSAAAMTLANPFTLLYDVGFQLSCLATFGLLAFSEPFERRLWFVPPAAGLRGSLSTTLAASFPTLPLLAYQFESLSAVSPLTNMLILPLIPHLMWLGALAVVVHPVSAAASVAIAKAVTRGCHYILDVSARAAELPWAAMAVQIPSWLFICSSALIVSYGAYLQKRV